MSQNKIIGIIGLIIAVVYGYAISTVASVGTTLLTGTRIFPILIATATAVFSLLILSQDFKKDSDIKKLVIDMKVLGTIGVYVVIFIIYTIIFESAGFILSTMLMLFAMLSVINKGKLKTNLLVGIIFPIAAYGIFAKIFAISLPPGIIHF